MRNNTLFILLLLLTFTGFGQEYLLDIENITPENGLANMSTTATFKDSRGFLWIGTSYGLNRYDGYEFKLFTKEKNGLSHNKYITRIEEDSEGNLWLFYIQAGSLAIVDVDVFNPVSENITPLQDYISEELPFSLENVLFTKTKVKSERIWIYDSMGQLFYYENKIFKKLFENPGKAIRTVTETKNSVLIGSENELIQLDFDGQILEKEVLPEPIHQIWATNTTLWLLTEISTFSTLNYTVWKKEREGSEFEIFQFTDNDLLKKRKAGYLHRDQNGLWYLSGQKKGEKEPKILVFDPSGNEVFDLQAALGTNLPIHSDRLFETSENLWLSSSSGIVKLNISKNPFQIIHTREAPSDTRGITEDESGNIYFLNGQIFQYNPISQKVKQLTSDKGAFNLIYRNSLLHTGFHSVTVSGLNFNLKTGEERRIPVWEGYTPSFSSIKTENPNIYIFGNRRGLSYFDFKTNGGRPYQAYNEFEELTNFSVYYFHENESGIWLATENGIYLMKRGKGIIQHFNLETGDLPFNHIRHISESQKGVFWLATSGGGVILWKPNLDKNKSSEFRQFTTENDLSNNFIYAVYPDDYGSLWIPSDMGLMQMDASDFSVKTYLTEDGLPHNEFNTSSHYRAKDGTFYFGGLGGLIRFHPKDFAKKEQFNAPLHFTDFYLWEDGEEKMTDKTESIQAKESIKIRPGDKLFELKFALLDFDKPENHRYSYKIEGFDERPNLIKENFLRITNLPYGNYQLKIKGQNITKGWSRQELTIPIRVLKPFYLQWWFIGLMLLTSIGLVIAYIFRREYRLRKEQERLESEVKNRTQTIREQSEKLKELDKAKTQFFSNITHEFRTPLTLILGPSEQLAQDNKIEIQKRNKLWNIHKNARHLLSLINQILDISKIESGQMRAEITRGDLVDFTKNQIESFRDLAKKQNQTLNFMSSTNNWETNFDRDKWLKILFNLISNALKFTDEGGFVNVFLGKCEENGQELIKLKVEDTGKGIVPEQLDRVFDRFYQTNNSNTRTQQGTGIGLALVKELVELLGGKISVSSKLGEGTCFKILLPILEANKSVIPIKTTEETMIPQTPILVEAATPTNTKKVKPISKKLDLLIIEDNEEVRGYIRECIDSEKYNITEAVDGEDGIQKALKIIPDLIISDVMMPKKDGFEVTKTIRENITTSHIPLVLLTAKSSLESRLQGLQRGADAYLTKPFSPKELTLRIKKLIEIRQNLQKRYQKELPVEEKTPFTKEDIFIEKIRNYILENIANTDLNGEMVSKHLGISRMNLYRKLKALTNQTISVLIKDIRLKKSFELLTDKNCDLNITEITYKTGFSNISFFSRTFKKHYGKSPSEVQAGGYVNGTAT